MVSASPNEVFELLLSDEGLSRIFTGYGILPAVSGASHHSGRRGEPDSHRRIHLKDGTYVHELITTSLRPRFLAYSIVEPSFYLDRLLAEGRGEWCLIETDCGTWVKWIYTFLPTNALTGLLLKWLVIPSWRLYMEIALSNLQRHFGLPE